MEMSKDNLPPLLMTSEPGSFARYTILERKPKILQRVVDDNARATDGRYVPSMVQALEALRREMAGQRLAPLSEKVPDVPAWNDALARYHGKTWLEVPWYFAEAFFYRRVLEAVHYFQPCSWQGQDPFGPQKREHEAIAVQRMSASWGLLTTLDAGAVLNLLLHSCLWGNRADMSYHSVAVQAKGGLSVEAERNLLLIDHTEQAKALLATGLRRVDVIADNAGMELLADLVLADHLLGKGWAQEMVFHLKDRPFFVSDAMIADVWTLIDSLQTWPEDAMRGLGNRLHEYIDSQRLRLMDDGAAHGLGGFWTSHFTFNALPARLLAELKRADLLILKGDANYRRLLGDRHWPHTTDLKQAVARLTNHFPIPFLTLRTLKAEIMVGLQPGQAEALAAEDPQWLINGKRGLIQLVE
jgi:uncharacterized protein with ATP-grasp and redox domains